MVKLIHGSIGGNYQTIGVLIAMCVENFSSNQIVVLLKKII